MVSAPIVRSSKSTNARRATTKQRRGQHVLDVSVRTTHANRERQRTVFRWVTKLLFIAVVVAGLYFGVRKGIALLLMKNPDYNVAELNVETDGMLAADAVLAVADLHKGSNIFLVNLGRAKALVEAIPQVEKAQVVRQLPNRITIQINERKPVAWVAPEHSTATREAIVASPQSHLVDPNGVLLPPNHVSAQDQYLPVIRNYTGGPRTDGQAVKGEEIQAALDLLHAHQDSMIGARFQIQEIDLAKHFGLEVTDRNGLQVLFGLEDMERQLKRLDVNLQVLDQNGQKPQTINLLVQKNVPVTFVTEPTLAASAPVPPPAGVADAPASSKPASPTATSKGKGSSTGKEKQKARSKPKPAVEHHHASHSSGHGLQPFGAEH